MDKEQILVVASNSVSRAFLTRLLEQKGYRVLAASLGKEGLIHAWRDRPDLIVCDSPLADLDVETFLHKLRGARRLSSWVTIRRGKPIFVRLAQTSTWSNPSRRFRYC